MDVKNNCVLYLGLLVETYPSALNQEVRGGGTKTVICLSICTDVARSSLHLEQMILKGIFRVHFQLLVI